MIENRNRVSIGFSMLDLSMAFKDFRSMAGFSYLDEHDPPKCDWTTVGGAIASGEVWATIEAPWRKVLEEFHVSEFHATDFAHSWGEFKDGWKNDEPKRREFISGLLGALGGAKITPIYATAHNGDFHQIKALYPEIKMSQYDICAEMCLAQIAIHVGEHPDLHPVAVFLHAGRKIKSRYLRSFLLGDISPEREERMHIQGVARLTKAIPLEVADLIVYEVGKEISRVSEDSERAMRYPLEQFGKQNGWPTGNILRADTIFVLLQQRRELSAK